MLRLTMKSLAQLCEEETNRENAQKDGKGQEGGNNRDVPKKKMRPSQMKRLKRRAHKREAETEKAQGNKEREPNTKGNTERKEESKGNSNGTVGSRDEFRHHVKKSGILELIERSLEQLCKEETERDHGP